MTHIVAATPDQQGTMTTPTIDVAATMTADEVLSAVDSSRRGLDHSEVDRRIETFGPNAIRSHRASALSVLGRQLNSPLLWLLFTAAAISAFVGEGLDAMIIAVILAGVLIISRSRERSSA